ncbi:DUF6151 family protein [Agarivorans sp. TSD2052]|uniref:DUF6151 family protein n=1 Tax=Agarivorans sp. TSD2052 TaxID=2937286 RepID=UPI00200F1142|nr:DUF6151 family protein [Agarivorans sp. TSD2052]UPW20392.1 DUF6151 family protein [Agarivorans sp. TSD2052]
MTDLSLQCQCGKVAGSVSKVKRSCCNRIVCYCKDCQKFAHYLSSETTTLDAYGGTEVYQLAPSSIHIEHGIEQLRCARLTSKGIYRWYSACCNTPIANTVGLKVPFVAIYHNFIVSEPNAEEVLGPVIGMLYPEQALTPIPSEQQVTTSSFMLKAKVLTKLFLWKLTGQGKPSPFYQASGKAIVKPIVLEKQ